MLKTILLLLTQAVNMKTTSNVDYWLHPEIFALQITPKPFS